MPADLKEIKPHDKRSSIRFIIPPAIGRAYTNIDKTSPAVQLQRRHIGFIDFQKQAFLEHRAKKCTRFLAKSDAKTIK
jgi:hypothetical protein